MRIAYADPPYPGQSLKHYGDHPDYAGEVDHYDLAEQLCQYDGWVLHTSSPALPEVLDALRKAFANCGSRDYRIMAWVKPFAAFKRNVSVAYAWEPVIVAPVRKPVVTGRTVMRDFISEPITMKRGLTGAKPEAVCRWCFEVVGAEPTDQLDDMFPGSGAVTRAWENWQATLKDGGMTGPVGHSVRRVQSAYARAVASLVRFYLELVGDPGVDSPLHFFVCWMVFFMAYGMPVIAVVCLVLVVT